MNVSLLDRLAGNAAPPLIIAEMSGNHNRDLERALAIVDAAAEAGAHALKIQTYTADTMTINSRKPGFVINDAGSLWEGRNLYDLYDEAHTPWEWHEPIFARCKTHGMVGFSSPFDATAVDFLEGLGVELYKIASFEMVDIPLIKKVAATGKPMIISTGMSSQEEIGEAVEAAKSMGNDQIVLLKCTSTYPSPPDATHISAIPTLAARFGVMAGLSDHTHGIGVAVASVAFGARVIEKHFTLSRADGGVDSAFSLEPAELKALVEETDRAWRAIGTPELGMRSVEKASSAYRRSLYIVQDVQPGDTLTPENLRSIRPGFGLKPKHYEALLGRTVKQAADAGTPMSWALVDDAS
ncbi:MAG: pseudaminic acid synthase [Myxococcales bacterium]|nr:pseudaminic acid synthase [Myxococcales bacterium]